LVWSTLASDFIEIYEENIWRIYGFLAYRVRTQADAEDLTQLTFERAYKAWGRFDEERASAATWLLAIARNALIDHARSDRSGQLSSISGGEVDESQLPVAPGPEAALGLDPDLALALERLSDRERTLIALRFGAEFKGPEIAELLDLTLANVQQILSRALRKLRASLDGQVPPDSAARFDEKGGG
jgi:RNA polymerase sigma-70 factor (ECF subfamily)